MVKSSPLVVVATFGRSPRSRNRTERSVAKTNFGRLRVAEWKIDGVALYDLYEKYPQWTAIDKVRNLALAPYGTTEGPGEPHRLEHPLFEPWKDEILKTGALASAIFFGDEPAEPGLSVGGGQLAPCRSEKAPRCEVCESDLTLCFQIRNTDLAPWLAFDGMLVAAYCFECSPDATDAYNWKTKEKFDGSKCCHIAIEPTNHWVEYAGLNPARTITFEPFWEFPSLDLCMAEGGVAAAVGWDVQVGSTFVDASDEYQAVVNSREGYESLHTTGERKLANPREVWRTKIGGYPSWDQDDVTPNCEQCRSPMKLLLDYNDGLFLDGSLHIFTCDRGKCLEDPQFKFVAEF